MKAISGTLTLLAGCILIIILTGCDNREKNDSLVNSKNDTTAECAADKSVAPFQRKLLRTAFDAATEIPLNPHIKDRSRAQEKVVESCLKLGELKMAIDFSGQIKNWRRGLCYAKIAMYYANHDCPDEAKKFLKDAIEYSEQAEDWRKDRVKCAVAMAYVNLGQSEDAMKIMHDASELENSRVLVADAKNCEEKSFNSMLQKIQPMAESMKFDELMSAMNSYAALYNLFYDDINKRELVEQKIKWVWKNQPSIFKIDLQMKLAECALSHGDKKQAAKWVNEAVKSVDNTRWPARRLIPLQARLAALQYRSGNEAQGKVDLAAALKAIKIEKRIVNIDRAEIFVVIAESYKSIGDSYAALKTYALAVEAGVENPNSRPRVEDLSAICCSMACNGISPDATLWKRISEICTGLGKPW